MSFAVAILGRPNVGKSTLFNRLVGSRAALVDNTPGLTRDRREGTARIADLDFRAIDTAGLEEAAPDSLAARMQAQTERALADADVALLIIDAREGVNEDDRHFADWLRRSGKPVVLVANKTEGRATLAGVGEAYRLGLGDPVPISAEHGEGLAGLYERLAPFSRGAEPEEISGETAAKPLHLAIVGRPNVGKSTLVNRLIGEDRLLTGPEAGITRDAIAVDWAWRGRPIRLVDTAGMRRRPRVEGKIEHLSVADALRTIRFAETVVLVLDALQPLERQDLTIARLVADEGRALVLAATKWDAVPDRSAALKAMRERLPISLPQLQGVRLVPVSGLTGLGLGSVDGRGRRRRRGVEPANSDRRPEPLARRCSGAQSATAGGRPQIAAALSHPSQCSAADLCAVCIEAERASRFISALSRQRVARSVRSSRYADPADASPWQKPL